MTPTTCFKYILKLKLKNKLDSSFEIHISKIIVTFKNKQFVLSQEKNGVLIIHNDD